MSFYKIQPCSYIVQLRLGNIALNRLTLLPDNQHSSSAATSNTYNLTSESTSGGGGGGESG